MIITSLEGWSEELHNNSGEDSLSKIEYLVLTHHKWLLKKRYGDDFYRISQVKLSVNPHLIII